ncbi:carbohydrate-binding domain-containing protein [Corynebacterium felinum]|uniref:Carbohydrate-binding domain-containing protein n=1 Tax=Corynebacterium felinum TaxID=131318 RepID=A0ABU2BAQ3_9CORY|nr:MULTISPECIES: carbohydrate-binding domain-containing protein [Corynebacterium]MDF5820021.1 carbohydrate-binding domain-containing protein [Corynebacterium felinum]MDO4760420.1 carbohydrate-binding domain-containing protein [Corynebacterium sp.]MDR7355680.1 hypothetical protein [Corynebacterium felinum]WJY95031.1 hypothetical protein CFELI_07080 [Corynebacterium felinum]
MRSVRLALAILTAGVLTACTHNLPTEEPRTPVPQTADTLTQTNYQRLISVTREENETFEGVHESQWTAVASAEFNPEQDITRGGSYTLSGDLPALTINAPEELVVIRLANATLPSITVQSARNVVVVTEGDNSSGVVRSNVNLTFVGTGQLRITSNSTGISANNVAVLGGALYISADGHGIEAYDSVYVRDAHISIDAGAHGITATDTTDPAHGVIDSARSVLKIAVQKDGLKAGSDVIMESGAYEISAGNNAVNGEELVILKADFNVKAGRKGIECEGDAFILGGIVTIDAEYNGINATTTAVITGGEVNIVRALEGIEALTVLIEGGTINITATDDGINASSGNLPEDRPNYFKPSITITGGDLSINAGTDGIDSNGELRITNGKVRIFVQDPGNNGFFDVDGSFEITGGTVFAAGKDHEPIGVTLGAPWIREPMDIGIGEAISIRDAKDTVILEELVEVEVRQIFFSSPELKAGETYTISAESGSKEVEAKKPAVR